MGNKLNRYALIAFICSLVPIVPAAFTACLCLSLSSVKGEAEGMAMPILILFFGLITVGSIIPMGIISVVFGNIVIRKPEPRGKILARVAAFLGMLEIAIVLLLFFFYIYYFRR